MKNNFYLKLIKLKYLLLTLPVICGSTGCASEDAESIELHDDVEITFSHATESRSTYTTTGNLTNKSFAVFGDMRFKRETDPASPNTIVLNGAEVKFSNNAWTYNDTQFWFPDHVHSFVALHPFSAIGSLISGVQYTGSRLSFNYTHPSNSLNTADLLIATHRRDYSSANPNAKDDVTLPFRHIMTAVEFTAKYTEPLAYNNQNNRIHVKKIELDGVSVRGSYTVIPDDISGTVLNSYSNADSWTITGTGSVTFQSNSPTWICNIPTDPAKPVFTNADALIMLPKAKGDVPMRLYFDLYVNGDKVAEHTVSTTISDAVWKAGEKVTYNLVISVGKVIIGGCTIEPWENIGDLTETITDSSGDHDAGSGNISSGQWTDINLSDGR